MSAGGQRTTADLVAWLLRDGRHQPSLSDLIRALGVRLVTAVSETLSGRDLITLLDSYFDAVVAPIERHGGEVLKFMGDSVLAVFPLSDGADQTVVHRAALAGAREGIAAVQALNGTWLARTHRAIGCGVVALHVGKVSYGNIGAADRLNFTDTSWYIAQHGSNQPHPVPNIALILHAEPPGCATGGGVAQLIARRL